MDTVNRVIEEHVAVADGIRHIKNDIERAVDLIVACINNGGKILLCGNGGSAADAQHIAGELVGRFLKESPPWPAMVLHGNTSALTAIGNDYAYDEVYARQVRAFGRKGDLLIAISTSGNSTNIYRATEEAGAMGIHVIGFTGFNGGKIESGCTVCLKVPSNTTPRIQEMHITIGHIICEMVEANLC